MADRLGKLSDHPQEMGGLQRDGTVASPQSGKHKDVSKLWHGRNFFLEVNQRLPNEEFDLSEYSA